MTATARFLVADAAAGWLAGTPDAGDRVAQLIEYGASTGELADLATELFDVVGAALGTPANCRRAAKRLEARAQACADLLLREAVDAGRYPHREGLR